MLSLAPDQEANSDIFPTFFSMKVYCVFTLESPHRGDSNEYTQYTIFQYENEKHPKLSQNCSYGIFSKGLKKEFERAVVNESSVFEPLNFYCSWLVGCFGLNGPLRQYFRLYWAVSQREGKRREK